MTTAADLAQLVQEQQAAESADLEQATVDQADAGATDALAAVATAAIAAWAAKSAVWEATRGAGRDLELFLADLRRQIEQTLAGLGRRAQQALTQSLPGAAALGAEHATTFARAVGHPFRGVLLTRRDPDVHALAEQLAADVTAQIRTALNLLTPSMVRRLGGLPGLLTGIGAARRATSMVRQRIAWAIHRAVNAAAEGAAVDLGAGRLWIAETSACPTCRAYSGRYAKPGEDFPGGISLDPRRPNDFPDPIPGPPRHPNCRCKTLPWNPAWGRALPTLLKAQAHAPEHHSPQPAAA